MYNQYKLRILERVSTKKIDERNKVTFKWYKYMYYLHNKFEHGMNALEKVSDSKPKIDIYGQSVSPIVFTPIRTPLETKSKRAFLNLLFFERQKSLLYKKSNMSSASYSIDYFARHSNLYIKIPISKITFDNDYININTENHKWNQ